MVTSTDPYALLERYALMETEFGDLVGEVAVCLVDAIRAVLDLHRRVTPQGSANLAAECAECGRLTAARWPCPTVRAIIAGLTAR